MNPSLSAPQVTAHQVASRSVVLGVDTHQLTHHAAVIDTAGRPLADAGFPVTAQGYRDLLTWARSHGLVCAAGVESTGSYGAGLTRYLLTEGLDLYEVSRPEKSTRVKHGKSDPVDAYSAAEQVRTGRTTVRPKITTGIIEALRAIKVPRDGAVKDRTRAYSQLRDLITTAPTELRGDLLSLTGKQRVARIIGWRPDPTRLDDPTQATKYALRALARRIRDLDEQIAEADRHINQLTKQAVPTLLAMPQIGPQTAAQLAITAGQNIDRMRSEASFAKLTGTAPLPASSGKTTRHRLNRGGDRQANSALHMIAIGRMRHHPQTRDYVERRRAQNMTNPDIIRCLKRHLARSTYRALKTDLMTP